MDVRKVVGLTVLRLRRERGISQEELSFRSGFGSAYLSGLETGKRNPTIVSVWEIATALDAEPVELLRKPAPNDPPAPSPPGPSPPGPKRRSLSKRQAIRASGLSKKR